VAAVSILYGSVRAMQQEDLKRRLAYSTVSQLSYITLGVALVGPLATTGALAHLVHQGIMKITLFLCAGVVAETLGIHRIREMAGLGRRLPLTMLAFTVAAVGMIGLPPTAGFVSKWYLGLGGLAAGEPNGWSCSSCSAAFSTPSTSSRSWGAPGSGRASRSGRPPR
jgi:multicomponent Na+:H+ antiporter subunit D